MYLPGRQVKGEDRRFSPKTIRREKVTPFLLLFLHFVCALGGYITGGGWGREGKIGPLALQHGGEREKLGRFIVIFLEKD